jgi:hypothetical protein
VQQHHDSNKAQGCHQDCRGPNLQTRTIIGVELKNIIGTICSSSTGTTSGTCSCCCASLCRLKEKRVKHCEKKKGKGRALSRKDRIQNALSNRNHQQVLFYDKPLSMRLTRTRTALGYEHSHCQEVITVTPLSISSLFCCHFQPFSVSISIII